MKTNIFFYNFNITKCDLSSIKTPELRFILITTSSGIKKWPEDKLKVFDKVITIDEMTVEHAAETIRNYKQQYGKDLALLTSEEPIVQTVAKLREQFDIAGAKLKDVLPFTDKLVMKDVLKKHSIRIPKHVEINCIQYSHDETLYIKQLEQQIPYPMFAKPTTTFGSAATRKILSRSELKACLDYVCQSKFQYELDEFIEGTLYHCDAVTQNGKVVYTMVSEYLWPCALFNSGYYPLGSIRLPKEHADWQALNDFNLRVLKALKLQNGATHLEAFKTKKSEIIFLEIAARAPGALLVPPHEKATGINLELEHFKVQMGISSNVVEQGNRDYYGWAYLPKMPGKVKKLKQPTIQSQYDLNWLIKEGDVISELKLAEADALFAEPAIAGKLIWHHPDFAILYCDFEILKKNHLVEYE